MQKKQIFTVVAITLLLLAFYYFGYSLLIGLIASQIRPLELIATSMVPPGFWVNFFALLAIPLMYLLVALFVKIRNLRQTLLVVGLILVTGAIFWEMQIFRIKDEGERFQHAVGNIRFTVSLESLDLHWHALGGMVVGAVIGALMVRRYNLNRAR